MSLTVNFSPEVDEHLAHQIMIAVNNKFANRIGVISYYKDLGASILVEVLNTDPGSAMAISHEVGGILKRSGIAPDRVRYRQNTPIFSD